MYEPHGSAFGVLGKDVANPVGTFWSVGMILEYAGEATAAHRVMIAIEHFISHPVLRTPDLRGKASTVQVTEAVRKATLPHR